MYAKHEAHKVGVCFVRLSFEQRFRVADTLSAPSEGVVVCPADCKLRPQPGVFERGTSYERDSPEPVRGDFGVVGVVECGATCVASEAVYFC